MKKSVLFLAVSLSLTGCNFLDFDESEGMTKEQAYGYFDNLLKLGDAAYRSLPSDFGSIGSVAFRESASDNSLYTWESNAIYDMYNGAWSPINLVDDQWSNYYSVIYDINSLLENYSEEQLERYKWDVSYKENIEKARMKLKEVTALRALYYFELVKRYGDVPLITKTLELDEVNSVEKTKAYDVLQFVANECKLVADDLPLSHNDFYGETGRVTKGAALAIRARALLYAASPLFIGEGHDQAVAWAAAARAAYDVIAMNQYSLPNIMEDPLYQYSMEGKGGNVVLDSPQLIFEKRFGQYNTLEKENLPIGFSYDTNTGNTPTQNLVDAFEMNDGTTFSWDNPENVAHMYVDENGQLSRDPRLYLTVLYNGSTFMGQTIETFEGGRYGAPITGATKTGYYLKKMMNEQVNLDPNNSKSENHHFPLYRYAEVLLNYAEAMNEWKGPEYTDVTCPLSAIEALNQVREAANMPGVASMDQITFREKVRNERRVELAFEDHRFWDIRRWMIGDVVTDIYGVKITKVGSAYRYAKELVQQRAWDNKMYLYPIPANETYLNDNLTQNKGW